MAVSIDRVLCKYVCAVYTAGIYGWYVLIPNSTHKQKILLVVSGCSALRDLM